MQIAHELQLAVWLCEVYGGNGASDLAGASARARVVFGIVRGLADGDGVYGARRRDADSGRSEHSGKRRGEEAAAKERERRKVTLDR
jgi:hypothetical protein